MRPPNEEKGDAQEKASPTDQGIYDVDHYNGVLLLALSRTGRLRLVDEQEAHALLDGRTPEITIRLGMPQVGWRLPDGRFMRWRSMKDELGHVVVIVPGKDWPVPFLSWAFRPEEFHAQFAGLTDRQLERHWPGFSRAMWDHWAERNRAHRARQDELIANFLAELASEACNG